MKTRKAPGPSEVSLELIAASEGLGIQVMAEICHSPRWILNANLMGSNYHAKGKRLHMCSVDLEKAFARVPRKVLECAIKTTGSFD